MIGLDTNVLLRLLTQDDPAQLAAAKRFVASHCTSEEPGFVNRVVTVEIVWVLESLYDEYSRNQIADSVEALLSTAALEIEDGTAVRAALGAYRDGADFADAFIARVNEALGCTSTATFDARAAKKLAHFTVVS